MSVIFLLGAVQALFLELIIVQKKGKSLADKILIAWFLFIAAHLSFVYIHFSEIIFDYPHLLGIVIPFPMLHGPFLYFYIDTITQKRPRFRASYWWHLLPIVLIYLYLFFPFFLQSATYKINFVKETLLLNPPLAVYVIQSLFIVSGITYVVWAFKLLKNHQKNIENNFSYTDQINLNWMWYLLVGISVVWAFVIITVPLEKFLGITLPLSSDYLIFISLSIFVFFIGFFGIQQTHIFAHTLPLQPSAETTIKTTTKRYEKSGLKETEAQQLKDELLQLMKTEKLYLDSKLSLNQIAQKLSVHPNYLSQVINESLGQNFYEFVNRYRINTFKQKVVDPQLQGLTFLAIAYECGFGSKSSFNNIFKKMEGMTPSTYVKSQKHN